jgi:hypothetical protein
VNTYSGATTVSAGTLDGNVSGSISSTNVTVNGGTLELDSASTMSSTVTLDLASSPASGAVNLNFSGTQTIKALYFGSTSMAAGTWGAIGSGANNQNAAFTGGGILNVTSGGTAQTITFPNPGTQTYGVAPLTLTATASSGLAVTYSVISGPATAAGSTLTIAGAGSVTVQASQTGYGTQYDPATPVSVTFTVNPASLSITANAQSKTYGQTLTFGSGSTAFTPSGLQNGDTVGTVTLACSGGVSNAPVSGSPYTITPSAATGGTFTPANYNAITYITNSLTVNPLTVVLTGTQAYNGTTNVTNSALSVSNALGGDMVTVASGAASMASEDIGTNAITSVGTLALGGPAGSNYSLIGAGGAVIVTPLPVTLTGTRPYDGTNDAASSILTIVTNYDSTNLTLSGSAVLAGSAGGVQSISDFTGLTLGGTAATNYTLTNASGSVTITPITPAFSGLTASQAITYGTSTILLGGTLSAPGPLAPAIGETITVTIDGNAQTTTISDTNGDFSLSYGSSNLPASGTAYTITYSYTNDASFNSASDISTALTVNPLPVILTGTEPYNGTPTAAFGYLAVVNAINGDTVTVASGTANLAGASVGPEAITSAGTLALGGLNAGNYTLAGASGSVTISNPFNPFSITSSSLDISGTNFVVCWQSVPGVVYNVLTNSNLSTANWSAAVSPITATNTTTCFTLPGGLSGTNVFVVITQ